MGVGGQKIQIIKFQHQKTMKGKIQLCSYSIQFENIPQTPETEKGLKNQFIKHQVDN